MRDGGVEISTPAGRLGAQEVAVEVEAGAIPAGKLDLLEQGSQAGEPRLGRSAAGAVGGHESPDCNVGEVVRRRALSRSSRSTASHPSARAVRSGEKSSSCTTA